MAQSGAQETTREDQKSAFGPIRRKAISTASKICAILAAMNSTMTPEDAIRIEAACTRLQTRYGTLADRQDPKFRELFAADATITLPEHPTFAGLDAIMAGQAQWRESGILMRHVVTNSAIDVIDAQNATGICYLMVFYGGEHDPEKGETRPTVPISLGEYHDRFVKIGETWLFKSRVLKRVFRGAAPA
jgi:SnoaL-like domain